MLSFPLKIPKIKKAFFSVFDQQTKMKKKTGRVKHNNNKSTRNNNIGEIMAPL